MNCPQYENSNLLDLRKFVAPEFVFGSGAALLGGQYAKNLRVKKALLAIGPHVSKLEWAKEIVSRLDHDGLDTVQFSDIAADVH